MLNWIYTLAGLVGVYAMIRNNGGVVAKTLYCVSVVIGIATAIFYGFTTYREVQAYRKYLNYKAVVAIDTQLPYTAGEYVGKIVISAVMIAIPVVASITALIAAVLVDRLAVIVQPAWRADSADQERKMRNSRMRLSMLAIVKIMFALAILGLCAFVEYERELRGATNNFIRVALDHIAAMLTVCSGMVDLYYLANIRRGTLNLKVALALSIIAAVWCIKTVDNGMHPLYVNDLNDLAVLRNKTDVSFFHASGQYIIAISQGVLMGCFSLLFIVCVISAIQCVGCFPRDFYASNTRVSHSLLIHNRCFSLFQMVVSAGLLALVVLGLIDVTWNGAYPGANLLWLAVLFFVSGAVGSENSSSFITVKFVLSVVSLSVAVEKTLASVNLVYQSVTYRDYRLGDTNAYVGQIVLYSIQLTLLAAEVLAALFSSISFGRTIATRPSPKRSKSVGLPVVLSVGALFYGVILTGCYVVYELGRWRFNAFLPASEFFRLANGPFAIAVFIVQFITICHYQLLLSAVILQVIVASLAFFTLTPAITAVYYIFWKLIINDLSRAITPTDITVWHVGVTLASVATLACILCTLMSTLCIIRSLYILSSVTDSSTSTIIGPYKESLGSLRTPIYPPQRRQIPVQQREEQSLYWSSDENPYFYQATRRYYGQPYHIDSGFYSYSLASPHYANYIEPSIGAHPEYGTYNRMQPATAQTRLGHIFEHA
ncbi:hypothetical protein AB6A40_002545 [Gnathostoma spinigerum]|uniref:Uncharacterized protein n=1 Tax=Gnathostoma spinigerum TaxID=75299 RepID=A0ABD6EEK6_9BILA